MTLGAEIAATIANHRYHYDNEDELQTQIQIVACRFGDVLREVKLNVLDRADMMLGRILIEVKIASSRPAVLRQLHRYAQSDKVDEIILVTNKAGHMAMPPEFNGKPIHVASLLGGAF